MLKKPKTNIQIMQENALIKYKQLTRFLREHYLDVYVEICNLYSEIMAKLYLSYFKTYIQDIQKLFVELYNKNDRILSDNSTQLRQELSVQSTGLQPQKSLYRLYNRQAILENNHNPIVYQVMAQLNQKCLIESIFKSIN